MAQRKAGGTERQKAPEGQAAPGGARLPIETLIARGRKHGVRKQLILRQAARLFMERGYADTGMAEIGEAAGITGSAVYRHFPSKQAILTALIDLSLEQLAAEFHEVLEAPAASPAETLAAVVDRYLEFSLGNRDLTVVVDRELVKLPVEDRRRFTRQSRLMREEWVHLLVEARPELSDAAARVAVTSVMGMVAAVTGWRIGLEDRALHEQLRVQAMAVLNAPVPR
ncbi:TetR/AcrR family transcriptional regulator [Streptomyces echinatus]|uniref:TetR/AcrR family transcriptional regulator n=1 Tax=Streptomyces echinatus TaxID=67293 RepID=UPI0037A2343F